MKRVFVLSLLSTVLVACGGSDSSGGVSGLPSATTVLNVATTPMVIDAQNEQQVAGVAGAGAGATGIGGGDLLWVNQHSPII